MKERKVVNGNPFQYSCLANPMGGGAWWAAVHGIAKSRVRQMNPPKKLLVIGFYFIWTQRNPPKLLQAYQCLTHELHVPFGSL